MSQTHCPMIHGALTIDLKTDESAVYINSCCLRPTTKTDDADIWNSKVLIPLREINARGEWDSGCWTCQGNEKVGLRSFRNGKLEQFGVRTNLSGPQRLDLMFDIGCNLACRTCGPAVSTFWQKHLKTHGIPFTAPKPEARADDMIRILKTLDLSNLEDVVFCGGETLMAQGYWDVAEAIADMVPDSKDRVMISFQTNGTQPISKRNYKTMERFKVVKLNISLDDVGERFEYLRWPAKWDQVVENITNFRNDLPVNVMFLIEQTISIFNLYYLDDLDKWAKENYSTNRLGDPVNHTTHHAVGKHALHLLSQEYVDAMKGTKYYDLIHPSWVENPEAIKAMVENIQQFDKLRGQDWNRVIPEVAGFYKRFTNSSN